MSEQGIARGAGLIRYHLQSANVSEGDRADLLALADSLDAGTDAQMDVWRFAHDFARSSGDSDTCCCVNCRAWRACQDIPPAT